MFLHCRIFSIVIMLLVLAGCSTNTISKTEMISEKGIEYSSAMHAFSSELKTERIRQADVELTIYRKASSDRKAMRDYINGVLENTERDLQQIEGIKNNVSVLKSVFEDLATLSNADYQKNNEKAVNELSGSLTNYNQKVKQRANISEQNQQKINKLLLTAFDGIRAGSIKKHTKALAKPVGETILLNTFMIKSFHESTQRSIGLAQAALRRDMVDRYINKNQDYKDKDEASELFSQSDIFDKLDAIEQHSDKMFALWDDYVTDSTDAVSLNNHLLDIHGILDNIPDAASANTSSTDNNTSNNP